MSDSAWTMALEEQETIRERHALMVERIQEMCSEQMKMESYQEYFAQAAEYLMAVESLFQKQERGELKTRSLSECEEDMRELYQHFSYESEMGKHVRCGNPSEMVARYGEETGRLLSFLWAELEGAIVAAFQGELGKLTLLYELFVQIYVCMEEDDIKEAKETIYWFFHDYSEIFVEQEIHDLICPEENVNMQILLDADLSDPRTLYLYGLPVGLKEQKQAEYFAQMGDAQLEELAESWLEGFAQQCEQAGKAMQEHGIVALQYSVGQEALARKLVYLLQEKGIRVTIATVKQSSFWGPEERICGVNGSAFCPQYEVDHQEDRAYYYDKGLQERSMEVQTTVREQHKKLAARFHGKLNICEVDSQTEACRMSDQAIRYDEKQQKLMKKRFFYS